MIIFATTVGIGGVTMPVLKALRLTSNSGEHSEGLVPVYPGYHDDQENLELGEKVDVWWEADSMWYTAFIIGKTRSDGWFDVRFVDDELKLGKDSYTVPAHCIRCWDDPAREQQWQPIKMMPSDLKATHRKLKVQLKATKRNWELKENKWEDQKGILTEEIEKLKKEIEAVSLQKARLEKDNEDLQDLCQDYKEALDNGDELLKESVLLLDSNRPKRISPEIRYESLPFLPSTSRSPRTNDATEI